MTWLRLMLVRESGDELVLASAAPRAWFAPTKVIEIKEASTLLGRVDFRMESESDRGAIRARVNLQGRPGLRKVSLFLRHPERRPMQHVQLDGHPWTDFDAEHEVIRFPSQEGSVEVVAYY